MTGNSIFDWSKFKIPSAPVMNWFAVSAPFNIWTIILRLLRPVFRLINVIDPSIVRMCFFFYVTVSFSTI